MNDLLGWATFAKTSEHQKTIHLYRTPNCAACCQESLGPVWQDRREWRRSIGVTMKEWLQITLRRVWHWVEPEQPGDLVVSWLTVIGLPNVILGVATTNHVIRQLRNNIGTGTSIRKIYILMWHFDSRKCRGDFTVCGPIHGDFQVRSMPTGKNVFVITFPSFYVWSPNCYCIDRTETVI
jgi:hypothetical protein